MTFLAVKTEKGYATLDPRCWGGVLLLQAKFYPDTEGGLIGANALASLRSGKVVRLTITEQEL